MTRFCSSKPKNDDDDHHSPGDPQFLPYQYVNLNFNGFLLKSSNDCVTRSFMFPNSKINNDLKLKVKAMTDEESTNPITNLTRVEVFSWLLYKCSVAAATKNNQGSFKPTGVCHLANIRNKMIEPLSESSIGNLLMVMNILTTNESEMKPGTFISELKKQKMQIQGLKDIETALGLVSTLFSKIGLEEHQRRLDGSYICTSLCRYPSYDTDFGWGKPVKVVSAGNLRENSFVLMDAPNGDGIEALVCLRKQDMAIFQNDPELIAFC